MDNQQNLNELALFAGAGGGILGGHLLGWRTVCAVEWEPYPACILVARQNDGILPPFPIWDDVQTFDGKPWRGIVDVVSGGFPCQDISAAGKGAGIEGARSGMWKHMARIVGEVRPKYVFVENSSLLVGRGLAVVISDLAEMGYDAQLGCISASDLGAPHRRDRIWLVATNASSKRCDMRECDRQERSFLHNIDGHAQEGEQIWSERICWSCSSGQDVANASCLNEQRIKPSISYEKEREGSQQRPTGSCGDGRRGWPTEPDVGRVAHGVAARVDRLKAIGNGQVPIVAATAFQIMNVLELKK